MSRTVLITGCAGFLGSHLAEHYLRLGWQVIGFDNFSTGQMKNIETLMEISEGRLHFQELDVTQAWSAALQKIPNSVQNSLSLIFHFASPASPPHYQRLSLETLWVNSLGLKNALEFADSKKAKVVFASTSEVYGDPAISPQPESYWGNVNSFGMRSCYDEAKRFGEALIYSHNLRNGTRHGAVRIFNTYGPRMNLEDGRVIINFLVQAQQGKPLTVYGDGSQTRSFCYVSDLVAGIVAYAESELAQPVNVGNDTEFTILELIEKIKALYSHQKIIVTHQPLPSDDPQKRNPDLTTAKKVLKGWAPKVPLSEGLSRMSAWLEQEGLLK